MGSCDAGTVLGLCSEGKAGTAGKAGVGVVHLSLSPVSLFSGRRVLLAALGHSCLSPLLEQDSVKLSPGGGALGSGVGAQSMDPGWKDFLH